MTTGPEPRPASSASSPWPAFWAGPGFQKMRDYLRRTCDDIWVIDCSPEGISPRSRPASSRACSSRSASSSPRAPSEEAIPTVSRRRMRFAALPAGHREPKFQALAALQLDSQAWTECPTDWRAPFLPASTGAWATYPQMEELFVYNGSGVMPGRTWVIAPDAESLERRWQKLVQAPEKEKEELFHPHLLTEGLGDRHSRRVVREGLSGYPARTQPVASDKGAVLPPTRYGFRSFDRQWIIPDNRLINRPNPTLWALCSERQVYLTAFAEESPTNGPALTFTGLIPDLHHYKGSFGGRVFPLWRDAEATEANLPPKLLPYLKKRLRRAVSAEDFIAYLAAVAAHPAFTARFQGDLSTPGLRIPITANAASFSAAVDLGRTIIWLHTFGERMSDSDHGRPAQPPRRPKAKQPSIPKAGAIPQAPDAMPNTIEYDPATQRLHLGSGYIDNIEPAVWRYEVSGKQVLLSWFSYRKRDRDRPIIGDRRPPSLLGNIQPDHWLAEYTTELLNVLNVLGWLVELEPQQAALLEQVCAGPTISTEELRAAGALEVPPPVKRSRKSPKPP